MSPHARRPVLAAASLLTLGLMLATTPVASARTPDTITVTMRPQVGCDLVRFYVAVNPSMNKPRGHEDAPDHWTWASGC
jgi:hypothetical protein